ncbi:MAG: alpha/beta hydrolase [Chloroflexia bacterium]
MKTRTYDEMIAEVMEHYGAEDYTGALQVLDREGGRYPDMAPMVYYLRSCMAARTGDHALAVGVIQDALDHGIFYGEQALRTTPSWQPLQGTPDFERVAALCKAREAEAQAGAGLLTVVPAGGCSEQRPCPALVALHGNAGDGESALEGWRAVTSQGWLLAAIQSSQIMATRTYMWDDQETALRDIAQQYAELRNRHAIDPDRVILAGFSLGGETALRAALTGTVPVRGFLILGPGGPTIDTPDEWLPLIKEAAPRGLRGYVLLGDQDEGVPQEQIHRLVEMLNEHGIPSHLEILPGHAHTYPRDPTPVLQRALAFLKQE